MNVPITNDEVPPPQVEDHWEENGVSVLGRYG